MNHTFSRVIAGAAFAALAAAPCIADDQVAEERFDISRFQIDGNTLLEASFVEALLQPYAGQARNFGHVQRALEALEAAYQQRGYNVVQVGLPEQELNQGVVRLEVVETRIGNVRVDGNRTFDEENIRASLPGLQQGKTPNLARVSSSLKLANENPAKKVTLRLQAGKRDDEVNAILKVVDEKPWRIGASVDNSGNATTGKTQLTTQFQHANIAGKDHVMSLQYTTTVERPSQVSVFGAGYHIPLYALGDSIDLFASHSDVSSATVLAGILNLDVSGKGTVFGGRYNQNLRRIGKLESALVYGLDHKAYRSSVLVLGNQLGNDVTVHPVSIGYTGAWASDKSALSFGVTAMHNIPGGSRGRSADFAAARPGARAGYRAVRFNATYTRALAEDWQARVLFAGQLSPDALVPGEQFGAGGQTTVRGFQEREIGGDSGQLLSAELYTPNLCGTIKAANVQCRALGFMDTAQVRRHNSQPGDLYAKASVGSLGLGFRLSVDKNMALQLDLGHVLDAGGASGDGDNRLHVKLAVSY